MAKQKTGHIKQTDKIGILDSGLGGLLVLRAIRKFLPDYSYIYLGDTLNFPYGLKSEKEIYKFACGALDYLFAQNCRLVIIACNTISAKALKKIQQSYLPRFYPDHKVLGVIIPTIEETKKLRSNHIALLATPATVKSGKYLTELSKFSPKSRLTHLSAPSLATALETGDVSHTSALLSLYSTKLKSLKPDTLILGCTHYGLLKSKFRKNLPKQINVISQDEVIPKKLKLYLRNHPEIEKKLSHKREVKLYVTKTTLLYKQLVKKWFGTRTPIHKTTIKAEK